MDAAQKSENNCTLVSGNEDLLFQCVKEREELDWKTQRDRPCDVTLVVGDEKEFKAHRDVLADSSPFFERLFNTDMKESKEGVIRLDTVSESVMKDILEFIYTGTVEKLAPRNAEEVIIAADYLLLSTIKTFAGRFLEKTICVSNCLSYLDFAEKYQCQQLADFTKDFIHVNFPAVVECEEFLNLSSAEVERWISSDEIAVSAEEDVFKFICIWIDQKKDERMPKFSELFRHVRLIYIPRDYLSKKVKKHSLVKNSEHCLARVTGAIEWLNRARKTDLARPQPIRKSLEKDVIVIAKKKIACYLPDTGTWYELPKPPTKPGGCDWQKVGILASREDKLDKFSSLFDVVERYDPLVNNWTSLSKPTTPDEDRSRKYVGSVTTTDESAYAAICFSGFFIIVAVWKYDVKSDSWRSITLPEHLMIPCVVFVDKFVYVIGGSTPSGSASARCKSLDTTENIWQERAPLQTARFGACGVATHGRIFVLGGYGAVHNVPVRVTSFEVYNMETNEWHFIASPPRPVQEVQILFHGRKLYLVGGSRGRRLQATSMECYDIDRNEWGTAIPIPKRALFINEFDFHSRISACSATIPKRTLHILRKL